jgi:hypothetical protein
LLLQKIRNKGYPSICLRYWNSVILRFTHRLREWLVHIA